MSALFEQALAAHRAGDFDAAERGYLAFRSHRNALHNLGALYNETARPKQAEACFREILAAHPEYQPSRFSLAMALLTQRRYAEAWPLWEARRPVLQLPEPATEVPEWRGEPLAGRTLVVCAEQGYGDQMMFARYLPLAREQGARVIVACDQARLGSLFQALGFETAPWTTRRDIPAADAWTLIGSLPLRLGLAAPPPPLKLSLAPASRTGTGVVVRGSPTHNHDRRRSLPAGAAAELLSLGRDLAPEATGARDFLETARILAGLERLIAVDTAIVHLAAMTGTPSWVLLAAVGRDWRWGQGDAPSDWHPCAELFVQQDAGDWGGVLGQVRARLVAEAS